MVVTFTPATAETMSSWLVESLLRFNVHEYRFFGEEHNIILMIEMYYITEEFSF